jgi:predicted dehydrogenase
MEQIAESGAAEVSAICDAAPHIAAETAKSFPGAELAGSFDELLDAGLDGIVIATPSAMHASQSIRALEKGIAVFCQKPLGRTEQEVREVVRSAERANRLLGVDLSYRYTTAMQQIYAQLRNGSVGEVFAAELVFHNAYGPDKPWFYDPKLAGGGCVMDLGIHLIDLALWVLDFPEVRNVSASLFAQGKPLARAHDRVEDYAIATLELSSGAVAQIACSWKLQAGTDAIIEANFYGTRGGLSFHNVNGSFYDFVAEKYNGTARETLAVPPDAWGRRAAVRWAEQLAAGSGFDPETNRIVSVARTMDAIYATCSAHQIAA